MARRSSTWTDVFPVPCGGRAELFSACMRSDVVSLLRTKSVEQSIADTDEPERRLKKNLGSLDLVVFGVGVTIGGGLFVLTGSAANQYAGPAIAISFVIAAIACGLAALCY